MTESLYGKVLSVDTHDVGQPTVEPATTGDSFLYVADASTFSETGGVLYVDGIVLGYTAIDTDSNSITLTATLPMDVDEQTYIQVYPAQPVKVATVDVGDDGDPVPAVVPHALVQELVDGVRVPESAETVQLDRRGTFEFVVTDVLGKKLTSGVVDPDRISIGLVSNLVQDPNLLTDSWSSESDWEIQAETTGPYAGINYLRSVSATLKEATPPYGAEGDSTYFITPDVPVESGRGIRLASLVRRDADADDTTLGTPLVRLRAVFELLDGTLVSDTDAYVEESVADLTVDTWTMISRTVVAPDGALWFRVAVQTAFQADGAIDFMTPEVQVLWDRVQSTSYVPGASGFNIEEDNAQFMDVQVVGEIGAAKISANEMSLNGQDVEELLDDKPDGLVIHAVKGAAGLTGAGPISTTEVRLFELSPGELKGGHSYRHYITFHLQRTVADDSFDFRLRYTTDGSAPTITSPVIPGSYRRKIFGSTNDDPVFFATIEVPTTANYRFVLTGQRATGTGTGTVYVGAIERAFVWDIDDVGPSYSDAAALSQKLKADGTGEDNPPIITVTDTWLATSSASYRDDPADGLSILYRLAGVTEMRQGFPSTAYGYGDQSLALFDYADIVSKLASAITILSCKIRFTVKSRASSAGLDVSISTHSLTNIAVDIDNVHPNITLNVASQNDCAPGSTYLKELGTTVGGQFKAGSRRGVGFHGHNTNKGTNYLGTIYGTEGSTAQKPRLEITYTKNG